MVTKSRLRLALAAEKGVDFKKLKEKRKRKENAKQKTVEQGQQAEVDNGVDHDEEVSEDDEEETDGEEDTMNAITVDESDSSDSSIEFDERITTARSNGKVDSRVKKTQIQAKPAKHEREPEEEEADDDEEEIPVSDLEDLDDEDREDLISHTRLTINNTSALLTALKRISMPTDSSVSFATHQSIVSSTDTSASIPDVSDDLQRELAFYSQSLDAVREGRARLRAEGVHFSRPKDYFAEMVKEDAHMEKVKAKLVEEAASKKAATEARKLRDLKKFGKQVQVAKLQERQKAKRETLDKIKTLKRKRQESGADVGAKEADLFDVGVENELAKGSHRTGSGRGQMGSGKPNQKRQKKNDKYGFGGKKRHSKSGDAMSSGDLSGFDAKKMKAGSRGKISKAPRPGKSKRKAVSLK